METEQSAPLATTPETVSGQQPIRVMAALIKSVPEGRECGAVVEALVALCWRLWGWNVERFRDELAKEALVQNTIDRSGPYANPID